MAQNICIKYDIGDNIRFIYKNKKDIMVTCPCCNGVGIVIGYDGSEYDCPECEGNKEVFSGKVSIEAEEREGTISSIHLHYDSNLYSSNGKGFVNLYYQIPQSNYHIKQGDIIEKIVSEEEKLGYTD